MPPNVVFFINEADEIQGGFVIVDTKYIACEPSIKNTIITLLAAYYMFDLEYPQIYGQLLGFLQEKLLTLPFTFPKCSNYIMYSSKLKL